MTCSFLYETIGQRERVTGRARAAGSSLVKRSHLGFSVVAMPKDGVACDENSSKIPLVLRGSVSGRGFFFTFFYVEAVAVEEL